MRRVAGIIGPALFFLALVNFGAFAVSTFVLGGDALSGKQEDGHFYVSHKGNYTEVSEAAWRYSLAQSLSVFVTHPLGMLGAVLFGLTHRRIAIFDRDGKFTS